MTRQNSPAVRQAEGLRAVFIVAAARISAGASPRLAEELHLTMDADAVSSGVAASGVGSY
jgi:hypothetical protein